MVIAGLTQKVQSMVLWNGEESGLKYKYSMMLQWWDKLDSWVLDLCISACIRCLQVFIC